MALLAEVSSGIPLDVDFFMSAMGSAYIVALAVPGMICILIVKRSRVGPADVRLADLLTGLSARGGVAAPSATKVERVNPRRGLAFGLAGAAMLLAVLFMPLPEDPRDASNIARGLDQLRLLALFLIVTARRYFQVSADSLLAADRRAPILFLRSFADDEKVNYTNAARAVLDFSLETRLANHFMRFGPFIAIGSPKDTVPQPGAARVLLSDDEWQGRVLDWMRSASVIIMYSGTTKWVNWELRQVIDAGRATSLILMFPEVKGWRRSRRRQNIAARTEQVREVFCGTPWTEELEAYADFESLRAMLFRADGSMVMIRSRSRRRDAYHLAAMIAHQEMLDPTPVEAVAPHVAARPRRRVGRMLATGAAGMAAIVGAAILLGSAGGDRLSLVQSLLPAPAENQVTFGQSDIRFDGSVTEAEARSVGAYLMRQGFLSDDDPGTVQLGFDQDAYHLRFVVKQSYADDLWFQVQLAVLGGEVGRDALGGTPVRVEILDKTMAPITTLPLSERQTFQGGELYYTEPVTAVEARRVGEHFESVGFFENGKATSVLLGWQDGAFQLRYVIEPLYADDPETLEAFSDMTRALAEQALGGQPIVMHLCDGEFRTFRQRRLS